jgi:hypothetical protein
LAGFVMMALACLAVGVVVHELGTSLARLDREIPPVNA